MAELKKLKTSNELKSFMTRLSDEERGNLERQLLDEGCRDPIRVWSKEETIIDGHNRYDICHKHGIPFDTVEMDFETKEEVKAWMARNQLARRNLTDESRRYYIGQQYLSQRGSVGRPKAEEANGDGEGEAGPKGSTADKIAEAEGVTAMSVHNAANYAETLDEIGEKSPELKDAILAGEVTVGTRKLKEIAGMNKRDAESTAKAILKGDKDAKKPSEKTESEPAKKVVKDGLGKTVTDKRYIGVMADADEFAGVIRELRHLKSAVKRLSEVGGGSTLSIDECSARFKGLIQELEERTPFCVCTKCKGERTMPSDDGKNRKCEHCAGLGWMDVFKYERRAAKSKDKAKEEVEA